MGNGFFVLLVFTRNLGTKCLSFSWTYGVYDIFVETCSYKFLKSCWISKIVLSPRVINPRTRREDSNDLDLNKPLAYQSGLF